MRELSGPKFREEQGKILSGKTGKTVLELSESESMPVFSMVI